MIYETLCVLFLHDEHLFIGMSLEQQQQNSGITSRSLFNPEVMIKITENVEDYYVELCGLCGKLEVCFGHTW